MSTPRGLSISTKSMSPATLCPQVLNFSNCLVIWNGSELSRSDEEPYARPVLHGTERRGLQGQMGTIPMYTEDDLLPISALQHLEFCPRRCALIHIEGAWTENVQTAEGRALHQRVHESPSETVAGVRVARGLRLCSRELGLFGVADVVEFHPTESHDERVVTLPGSQQRWIAFPVEYKRGRRKSEMSYAVQLCAQALCLEEMLGGFVPAGALYHGQSRRRQVIPFDEPLRHADLEPGARTSSVNPIR